MSCILTTCNRPPNIFIRALKSIFSQTYKNIEVIVINDSPDSKYCHEISNIISHYRAIVPYPLFYLVNRVNKGANYSRNKGIKYSHGEFIAFLDDDDEWLCNKISTVVNSFAESDAGLVYSDYRRITLDKKTINVYKAHRRGYVFNELLAHNIIGPTSGVVIRQECLNQCGLFDPLLPARQDYDLWIRITQQYKVLHINQPLYIYHDSIESISTNINRRIQGRDLVLKKYSQLYHQNKVAYKYTLIEYYYEMLLNMKIGIALKIFVRLFVKCNLSVYECLSLFYLLFKALKKETLEIREYY